MISLRKFIFHHHNNFLISKEEIYSFFTIIELVVKIIRYHVSLGNTSNFFQKKNTKNIHGENQITLDIIANNNFKDILKTCSNIAGIVSEEEKKIITFQEQEKYGKYIFFIDPVDGSSNADINIPIGTIFSIYPRVSPIGISISEQDFLQPGNQQIMSGYILYGPATILVFTIKSGVHIFTYHPSYETFILSQKNVKFPDTGNIYSINEGNYNSFPKGIKKYLQYCKNQYDQNPISSRYVGSLVADFHRSLLKGGIYLYPNTQSYMYGKLRLMYECNPIAYLAEEASGKATNGDIRILDIIPKFIHQCSPFFSGTASMVEMVKKFILDSQSDSIKN
ncbi:fructose-1,6-bisphosphatase I [Wigglesworthia glossinidia endosymbiont of Glossina morsitans morsitans (Yale colony)]|uniref:Fructose-1,6-bisphosphatase class 1 n=1 Tax=Wigglesworthia glossinidia endosymbiont of Glossina morsitans morsitans (Yale colony) TaxID=1142511 RepID=H6Q4Q8_WIGGL|nr:class 1 fructose-bisphosphatase [Wigglesworthia glossinidia]AFA41118.1 fructose-1,6-bisphosphatase I [Wigglesworthia glossinidia endosymbiont of Glossina morsitans morsitans (Yale colony)]